MKIIKNICLVVLVLFVFCSKDEEKISENTPIVTEKKMEIKGADISYLPEIRKSGILLKNSNNQTEDMLITLKNSGVIQMIQIQILIRLKI